jgi:hypothetical protein
MERNDMIIIACTLVFTICSCYYKVLELEIFSSLCVYGHEVHLVNQFSDYGIWVTPLIHEKQLIVVLISIIRLEKVFSLPTTHT